MDKLDNRELLELEKMARLVCMKYERTIKNYDGTISNDSEYTDRFKRCNSLHERVLREIENRIGRYV